MSVYVIIMTVIMSVVIMSVYVIIMLCHNV